MSQWLFISYTTVGSLIWATALAAAGYTLKAQFDRVETWLNPVTNALLLILVAVYFWRLLRPSPAS